VEHIWNTSKKNKANAIITQLLIISEIDTKYQVVKLKE